MNDIPNMRKFILIAEDILREPVMITETVEETVSGFDVGSVIAALEELNTNITSHFEPAESEEYAMGFDAGMQRASEMLSNLTRILKEEHGGY